MFVDAQKKVWKNTNKTSIWREQQNRGIDKIKGYSFITLAKYIV